MLNTESSEDVQSEEDIKNFPKLTPQNVRLFQLYKVQSPVKWESQLDSVSMRSMRYGVFSQSSR